MLKGLMKGYLLTKAFRMFTGSRHGGYHSRRGYRSGHSGLSGLLRRLAHRH